MLVVRNKLNLDEELDLEKLSLKRSKALNVWHLGMDNQKLVFYIKDFQVESARTMGQAMPTSN